ncbi:MAG: hypothetical protein KDK39_15910 [Leptospiraceae bacterium]|nr:hypothetical protein [Leptospiraceae bacterium]
MIPKSDSSKTVVPKCALSNNKARQPKRNRSIPIGRQYMKIYNLMNKNAGIANDNPGINYSFFLALTLLFSLPLLSACRTAIEKRFQVDCTAGDCVNGQGVWEYDSGLIYEGQFLNELPHGQGGYQYQNGNTFAGPFQKGYVQGTGILKLKDGRTLTGHYNGGTLQGYHLLKDPGGKNLRYEEYNDKGKHLGNFYGVLKANKPSGQGRYVFPEGTEYEGSFENGVFHGAGKMSWPNKDSYAGDFSQGMRHGQGVYTFANGLQYRGSFEKNNRHGKGQLWNQAGQLLYSGPFKTGYSYADLTKNYTRTGSCKLADYCLDFVKSPHPSANFMAGASAIMQSQLACNGSLFMSSAPQLQKLKKGEWLTTACPSSASKTRCIYLEKGLLSGDGTYKAYTIIHTALPSGAIKDPSAAEKTCPGGAWASN